MHTKKIDYLRKMLNWLLPYTCIVCHYPSERRQDLCAYCYKHLPWTRYNCFRCAIPLPANSICGHCLQKTPPFDDTHALFLYQPPIVQFILELKFKKTLIHAQVLGELLATHIQEHWYTEKPLPDIIIPIPLHPKRLKERGYNQALEIARPIAKRLKLPIDITTCQRTKATTAQTTLSAAERQHNIQHAFTITHTLTQPHIAVIDDVITTGCTMTEFCKTLKQNGAQKIDVWCCARAGTFLDYMPPIA